MTIDEAKQYVGSGVVYDSGQGKQDGVISSVNSTWVFVRYSGDLHSKATDPNHLSLLAKL